MAKYELIRDKQPKPKQPYVKCNWYSDLTSIAVRKQHKPRFMKLRKGLYFKAYAIVLYNKETKTGFYTIVVGNPKPIQVLRFIEKLQFRQPFKHDKGFHYKLCRNGMLQHGYRDKQIIEHLFGFKVAIYRDIPNTAIELLEKYRHYFNRLGLKEVNLT